MSTTTPDKDNTFRKYAPEDAARYASFRIPYPPKLINTIISTHESTGGHLTTLLDVGCGPGTATHSLAPLFTNAYGADPGAAMIEAAQKDAPITASGAPVRFFVSTAEDLLTSIPEIKPGSVDLITAATAAHWFKLPGFYAAAAELLKPGGSIAMWCTGPQYCDPYTTPNVAAVQAAIDMLQEEVIAPFEVEGNRLCHDLYAKLDLPWTIKDADAKTQAALDDFDEGAFQRIAFNEGGELEPGQEFVRGMKHASLEMLKKVSGTASPVQRWREAHKEQMEKGEVEDCLDRMARVIKEAMGGRDWIDGGTSLVLLVIKKKDA
ncbi:S-adenosyl-L-methionine-dependent methyltransferase [Lophium mytilinum]|uniref:S-adenosyl-L-methionine-dependent methyltransferase n=1 Tax=Lophium mytilinum TaxID=390894 RepID=A0A6A6R3T0_9PEZI|nr:S-adenosyl-L-methionine-dependent methyltransferase [Lophium mytilinum]